MKRFLLNYGNCFFELKKIDFLKVGIKIEDDQLAENVDPEDEIETDVEESEESKTEGASNEGWGTDKNEETDKTDDIEDDEASSSKNKKERHRPMQVNAVPITRL